MSMRKIGTTTHGGNFDATTVQRVWNKGQVVPGYDPAFVRKDGCGAWIQRTDYGTTTDYGWEVDHIQPVARGGSDALVNLQPLQWKNNRHKGDSFPQWSCALSAA